uniref:Uncharacterized protein n=1 Tax=Bionectria ochroleuca TaxID=29856 RepID=A0A8H7TVQ3_BIOOC
MTISHTHMAASHRHRKWTMEEDMVLRYEVEAQRDTNEPTNWAAISEKLPHRSNKDCRKRWLKTVEVYRKGPWTADEDQRLLAAMDTYGTRWNRVAQRVGTRNADQCAKRWQHSLDPKIDRGPWTSREDDELLKAVSELGRSWRLIASSKLPSRSPTDLKNRYELMCRRRQDDPPGATLCDDPTGTPGSNAINQGDILAQSFAQAQCFAICPPHEANGNLGLLTPHSFNDWEHLPSVGSQLGLDGGDPSFSTTGMESWMNSPGIYSTECDPIASMALPEQATPPESSSVLPDTAFPPSSRSSAGLESRGLSQITL